MLAKYKMIEKTGPHRKSKSDDAKGREIFQYRLVSKKAAAEFVRVSGALPLTSPKPAEKQSELFA
jgi:hypothetical protein